MKHWQNSAGFTLVEVIVTAAFVATASVAIIEVFVAIGGLNRQARDMAAVTQVAQSEVEDYRNTPFDNIASNPDFTSALPANIAGPKTATATITDLDPTNHNLKQLDVAISYTEGGVHKDVQVTTLITRRGIDPK